jgi:hypothetical protein
MIHLDSSSPGNLLQQRIGERSAKPEERLMLEVFTQACADLHLPAYGAGAERLRRMAQRWFESDDDTWPLSFASICRHFAIEPRAARGALLQRRSVPPPAWIPSRRAG